MAITPVPKPQKRAKAPRKRLTTKTALKRSTQPLAKRGATKAKKVARQQAFYRSKAWKLIRSDALQRAGRQCEYVERFGFPFTDAGTFRWVRCEETTRLEIHHRSYQRFGGQELPEDLQCLCARHHRELEARDFPHRQRPSGKS